MTTNRILKWKMGRNDDGLCACSPSSLFEKTNCDNNGYFLRAIKIIDEDSESVTFDTRVKVRVPTGFVGDLYPVGGLYEKGLYLIDTTGVIDSDCTDNIILTFLKNKKFVDSKRMIGEKIGQFVIKKCHDYDAIYFDSDDDIKEVESTVKVQEVKPNVPIETPPTKNSTKK